VKMDGSRSMYSLRSRLYRLNQKKKKTTDAETTIGSKPGGEDDDDNTEDAPEHMTEDNGNSEDAEQDGIDSTNYNRTERKRKYESPVNDDKWMLHHKRLRDYCKNLTTFPTLKMLNNAYTDFKLGTWVYSQRSAYRNKRNYEISDERVALLNKVRGWK